MPVAAVLKRPKRRVPTLVPNWAQRNPRSKRLSVEKGVPRYDRHLLRFRASFIRVDGDGATQGMISHLFGASGALRLGRYLVRTRLHGLTVGRQRLSRLRGRRSAEEGTTSSGLSVVRGLRSHLSGPVLVGGPQTLELSSSGLNGVTFKVRHSLSIFWWPMTCP